MAPLAVAIKTALAAKCCVELDSNFAVRFGSEVRATMEDLRSIETLVEEFQRESAPPDSPKHEAEE